MLQPPLSASSIILLSPWPVPAEPAQQTLLSWHAQVYLWAWGLVSRKLSKEHRHARQGNHMHKPRPGPCTAATLLKLLLMKYLLAVLKMQADYFFVVNDVFVDFLHIFLNIK